MENKHEAIYEVIQTTASAIETEVEFNGVKITASVPSLVVQLKPATMASDNSVIKLVFPGVLELAPFVLGENVRITFDSITNAPQGE